MGHNLGLDHTNVYPPAYMSAIGWAQFPEDWLQPDDKHGIQSLYGGSNRRVGDRHCCNLDGLNLIFLNNCHLYSKMLPESDAEKEKSMLVNH